MESFYEKTQDIELADEEGEAEKKALPLKQLLLAHIPMSVLKPHCSCHAHLRIPLAKNNHGTAIAQDQKNRT